MSVLILAGIPLPALAQGADPAQLTEISPDRAAPQRLDTGLEQVIPGWVRGTWRYTSTIVQERGFRNLGRYRQEALSLPGDLSPLYFTHYDNGDRLTRLCWQVLVHNDREFRFIERLRDRYGAVLEDSVDVRFIEADRASIRQRTVVLDPGSWLGHRRVGGLFEFAPGSGGAFHVRTGVMRRDPGSEQIQLPEVDLAALRCR